MTDTAVMTEDMTQRLAQRLAALRSDRGLTLDALAEASGLSRAALSRFEKAEVSPTAEALGRLCHAYGLSMSRLMAMVEEGFTAHLRRADQPVWRDRDTGFLRRVASPGGRLLAAEVLDCELDPGACIAYPAAAVPGMEHHLLMLSGTLMVEVDGTRHDLDPGDSLRYRLSGPTRFAAGSGAVARYILVLVAP